MIGSNEKKLIHQYARAAKLTDAEYRDILEFESGKRSTADPEFTHTDTDHVLVALETVLWERIRKGVVRQPKQIRNEFHFRHKYGGAADTASPRQLHRIDQLWCQLSEFLETSTPDYLMGITFKATGVANRPGQLTRHQAAQLIQALKDRLAYGIQLAEKEEQPK